jgi:hypothetical protein
MNIKVTSTTSPSLKPLNEGEASTALRRIFNSTDVLLYKKGVDTNEPEEKKKATRYSLQKNGRRFENRPNHLHTTNHLNTIWESGINEMPNIMATTRSHRSIQNTPRRSNSSPDSQPQRTRTILPTRPIPIPRRHNQTMQLLGGENMTENNPPKELLRSINITNNSKAGLRAWFELVRSLIWRNSL